MTKTTSSPSLNSAFSHEPADKRIDILRLTGESGSISQAAREAGVSYKAAWQAIETLSNLAGVVLVERAIGGIGGGGATLTAAGQKLLFTAGLLKAARDRVLASVSATEPAAGRMLLPPSMGVRTSMRNQFPCRVQKLELKGQVVRVHLQLPQDAVLVSRITRVSAELLGLYKGREVLALCKATAVIIKAAKAVKADGIAAPAERLGPAVGLFGKALRISRSTAGDEVSLELNSGLQLVGFAAAGSGLRPKDGVTVNIDEAALVIALGS